MTITNYVMLITKNRPHSLFPLWIHLILLLWWTKPTSTATTRMHAGNWKVETKRPSSIVTRARNTLNYRSPSNVGYSRVNFQDYRSTGYSRTYLCPTRRAKYLNYFIVSLLLATRNMADSSRLLYAEVKCTFAVFFSRKKRHSGHKSSSSSSSDEESYTDTSSSSSSSSSESGYPNSMTYVK